MAQKSRPEVFLRKGVLKICSKFTWEHPCQSVVSVKLLWIILRHGYSHVNLLHIFRAPFLKNTSGGLLLIYTLGLSNMVIHHSVTMKCLRINWFCINSIISSSSFWEYEFYRYTLVFLCIHTRMCCILFKIISCIKDCLRLICRILPCSSDTFAQSFCHLSMFIPPKSH